MRLAQQVALHERHFQGNESIQLLDTLDAFGEDPGVELTGEVADEPVRLEGWAGRVVLPNVGSETYAQLDLDEASTAAFADGLGRLEDPLARAVVWGQWFDGVRTRRIDPLDYLAVVTRH